MVSGEQPRDDNETLQNTVKRMAAVLAEAQRLLALRGEAVLEVQGVDCEAEVASLAEALRPVADTTVLRRSPQSSTVLVRSRTEQRELRVCVIGNVDAGKVRCSHSRRGPILLLAPATSLARLLARASAAASAAALPSPRLRPPAAAAFRRHSVLLARALSSVANTRVAVQSTLVGVLTRGVLDDGRGAARSKVFRHPHEEATGRTSSVSQHNVCFDSTGKALEATRCGGSEVLAEAAKILCLIDLCGHERYLKTTCYGLTGTLPDYACVIVGGNAGLVGMSREHYGLALALRIPVFFVVSKIDMAPEQILKETVAELSATLRKPGVRKRPLLIKSDDDVFTAAANMASDAVTPIFLLSAVDGRGLARLRLFLNLLPQREDWGAREAEDTEFLIDEVFQVPGVGTVVAGTLRAGSISDSTRLMLGPDPGDGLFKLAAVKSLHYKAQPVSRIVAGQTAALALKKVKRKEVRKGMVLVAPSKSPSSTWTFFAEISVLTHSTTISPRYEAVVHLSVLRQTASIELMDRQLLRSGDRAIVRFRFKQRPEYVVTGTRFVFREGRTKGIGVVVAPPPEGLLEAPVGDPPKP